jgi:hypothetical protein
VGCERVNGVERGVRGSLLNDDRSLGEALVWIEDHPLAGRAFETDAGSIAEVRDR